MLLPDVRINLGRLFAAEVAIRTLVPRLKATLELHVSVHVALESESTLAFGTVVLLLTPVWSTLVFQFGIDL